MGVVHFAPVGISPGAVTSALSYLKHNPKSFQIRGHLVEGVVVFVSPEVRNGSGEYVVPECVNNQYGSINGPTWKNQNVLRVISRFIETEMADVIPEKGFIDCCVIDPNKYQDCFEKVAKAALRFSGGVGKHIWANLTGGTNIVNAALLEVAFLSGLIARIYYTFLSDISIYGKYLQPPSKDVSIFRWDYVPFAKTDFDVRYYRVLREFLSIGAWCGDQELLNRLRADGNFARIDLGTIRREFLNKMDGRELEREILPDGSQGSRNRLSQYGRRVIQTIDDPLFQLLIKRGGGLGDQEIARMSEGLELEKIWRKP